LAVDINDLSAWVANCPDAKFLLNLRETLFQRLRELGVNPTQPVNKPIREFRPDPFPQIDKTQPPDESQKSDGS
jgi:hypothetical protein